MASGDQAMVAGNVLVARQFYQRAAENGLPEGAQALAATYDVTELARSRHLVGVQPNPELAKKWSDVAEELRSQQFRVHSR
jgi:TPR repeat protein